MLIKNRVGITLLTLDFTTNIKKYQGGNMENNKNLLTETLNLLEKNNRTWEDVTEVFVVGKYNIGKDEFHKLASSTNYNWDKDEINRNLVIKGNDFIINVHYAEGFRTYLDLIDLKVPELSVDNPNLFNFLAVNSIANATNPLTPLFIVLISFLFLFLSFLLLLL